MPRITSLEELNRLKVELVMQRNQEAERGIVHVTVGMGTCGIAVGALAVFEALQDAIRAEGLTDVVLSQIGCIGLCRHEPIVEVTVGKGTKVSYGRLTPAIALRILHEHIVNAEPVQDFVIDTTPFPTI
jgi:NADP-reducing hydrogenase subunit HndB